MQRILYTLFFSLFSTIVSAKTILVVGDSLSAAYNMPLHSGWVELLRQRIEPSHRVVNSSISGDTSAGGIARLPQALDTHKPDIVILELGANDGLRGLSLKQMKRNLADMIRLAHSSGAEVLLAGMELPPNYGPVFNQRFRQIYTELASEERISLIPFFLDDVAGKDHLIQPDGLHPNERAQPMILDNVWPHLEKLLL